MTNQAKRTLALADVPAPEGQGETQPNGDRVVIEGDCRWRYKADGTLSYFIRQQAGQSRDMTPYEEMYRGPR